MDDAVPPRRIAVVATLDTKGDEAAFVAHGIRARGHEPVLVDVGLAGTPRIAAAIDRDRIAAVAGPAEQGEADRTKAMIRVGRAAGRILAEEVEAGRLHGAIAIGGGTGRWIAAEAMAALPIGLPKLIVTTVVNSDGRSDIAQLPSVADIAGLNRLLVPILNNAVGAISGMVEQPAAPDAARRRTIAMTMFGVTTEGGTRLREYLEEAGCEVVVFHATGAGGDTMEKLARDGMFDAVVDWTTSEITDHLVGGICASGPGRLEAAGELGIPQVIVPGAVDVINVRAPIPAAFEGRTHHWHLPTVPLLRTSAAESARVGSWIADKLDRATGPTTVVIPRRGYSSLDIAGGDFEDPGADEAFETALREGLRDDIPVLAEDLHINDAAFARVVADTILAMLPASPEDGDNR
jgi:uncharacterized protein (UPF0261 family)